MITINLNKEKITNKQLIFLLMGFIIGNIHFLPPESQIGNKVWLAVVIGLLESLIFIWIYTTIPKKFNNQNFTRVLTKTFGKPIGKCLIFLFSLYCFHLGTILVRYFVDFNKAVMLPLTPSIVLGFAFLCVCLYAAYNGISVISRNSQILVSLTIISVILTILLLLKDMKVENFKPFFYVNPIELLKTSHTAASFPLGETVVFLFMFPFVNNQKKIRGSTMKGVIFGTIVVIAAILRNTGVLGILATKSTYPSAQALRLINFGNVITRLEIISFLILLNMGFIKASILLWCSTVGFSSLLNLKSRRLLMIILSILMLVVAITQFKDTMQSFKFITIYPLYAPIFQLLIPSLTLIVAKIRKII